MTLSAGIWVVCCQPDVDTCPWRVSTLTITRSRKAPSTSSRKSMSVNAAVPRMTRSAPARSASRTAGSDRRPPPYCTGTLSSWVIRSRCSMLLGAPLRAPSRSTTCRNRAPACTHARAASSGESR